jgi:hypothetical protein
MITAKTRMSGQLAVNSRAEPPERGGKIATAFDVALKESC